MDRQLKLKTCLILAQCYIWVQWFSFAFAVPIWDGCPEGNKPRAVGVSRINVLNISCSGFQDEHKSGGVHYIGHYINYKPKYIDHRFTSNTKQLMKGVKVTINGSIGDAGVLALTATKKFQGQLKDALHEQLGWMYLDNITYFGTHSKLRNTIEMEGTSGALAFQYAANCRVKLETDDGAKDQVGFRFESEELVFYMPSFGKCAPTDGFVPIINPATNTNQFENKGTEVLNIDLTMYIYLTWKDAPPAKFQDVYKTEKHTPIPNLVQQKLEATFRNKSSALTRLELRFTLPRTALLRETEDETALIAPGTVGHLYEHVLVCGDYQMFTAVIHQRAYSLQDGSCVNLVPKRKAQISVLEACDVCPKDLNDCDTKLILSGLTRS